MEGSSESRDLERSALFEVWAPPDGIWSPWAKPVLFAHAPPPPPGQEPAMAAEVTRPDWTPDPSRGVAVVVDLPGVESLRAGMLLARQGFRPVPLFNGCPGPSEVIDLKAVLDELWNGAEVLLRRALPRDAPPAFLLDARRLGGGSTVSPGRFDNRWMTFPQDFPSGNLLLSRGIREGLLVQASVGQPQRDLVHVLYLWQRQGLAIACTSADPEAEPQALSISKPFDFRSIWYRLLVLAGLRRNSAGGFGSIVPQPSSRSGFA